MAIATWKDLCIDAVDAHALGRFWGAALGLAVEPLDDGDMRLTGPTPQHQVWINTVPEPVTVKQRVHIDVYARSVEDVLALGATPEDVDSFTWKVLRDPEGGELCVFEPRDEQSEVRDYRLVELGVDSVEPRPMAYWWADVLGAHVVEEGAEGWYSVRQIPGAPFESIVFNSVPEPKTVKNRIHWDVDTQDLAVLTGAGATVLVTMPHWTVMADPEGNEFCAFSPRED